MAKYFFDTDDGSFPIKDEAGLDLPSDTDAREQAILALANMANSSLPDGERIEFSCSVRSSAGDVIYVAALAFVGGWTNQPDQQPVTQTQALRRSLGPGDFDLP